MLTSSISPHPIEKYSQENDGDIVFLLHGFGAHPLLLRSLERLLVQSGYTVINWGYRSFFSGVQDHALRLREDVFNIVDRQPHVKIHFVTHSMGGIVVRAAFGSGWLPSQVGRIVMMAPPNQGSHVARRSSYLFGWLCPVLHELSDKAMSLVNQLGSLPSPEIGVIAASEDWVVSRKCTPLNNQADFVVVPGSHVNLPFKKRCVAQVLSFLQDGMFEHPIEFPSRLQFA